MSHVSTPHGGCASMGANTRPPCRVGCVRVPPYGGSSGVWGAGGEYVAIQRSYARIRPDPLPLNSRCPGGRGPGNRGLRPFLLDCRSCPGPGTPETPVLRRWWPPRRSAWTCSTYRRCSPMVRPFAQAGSRCAARPGWGRAGAAGCPAPNVSPPGSSGHRPACRSRTRAARASRRPAWDAATAPANTR